jgi:hypothetical protein
VGLAVTTGVMFLLGLGLLAALWNEAGPAWRRWRFALGCLVGLPSLAGVVWMVIGRRVGPARLSGFDRERNTIRIRFANGRYGEMFEWFRKNREGAGDGGGGSARRGGAGVKHKDIEHKEAVERERARWWRMVIGVVK